MAQSLYIPLIMPREGKLITFGSGNLLETEVPEVGGSHERAARNWVAGHLGLTAAKAIAPLKHEDEIGYGVHTSIDQPFELKQHQRFIVAVHDIETYLQNDSISDVNLGFVRAAMHMLYSRR